MSTRKRKLTRDERKQIEAAIARAKGTDKKELSAQDSIPYERMWPDGICRVTDKFYTKTVQFQDINYQLSQNEDKTAIFEGWSDFLNCATRSRTNTILQGVRTGHRAYPFPSGRTGLTMCGGSIPKCCKTSLPRGTTA